MDTPQAGLKPLHAFLLTDLHAVVFWQRHFFCRFPQLALPTMILGYPSVNLAMCLHNTVEVSFFSCA
jgi:hypothetical protein